MRTLVVIGSVLLSVTLATSCGGKSKNKPVEPTPVGGNGTMGPGTGGGGGGGGGGYGGYGYGGYGGYYGGYGGDYGGYYGGNYGGGGGYYGGGGSAPRGVFDCVSGIPECDQVFQKYISCINSSKAPELSDPNARNQIIDAIQQMCVGMKSAANDQGTRGTMVQACQQMEQQGAQLATQMQCTW